MMGSDGDDREWILFLGEGDCNTLRVWVVEGEGILLKKRKISLKVCLLKKIVITL